MLSPLQLTSDLKDMNMIIKYDFINKQNGTRLPDSDFSVAVKNIVNPLAIHLKHLQRHPRVNLSTGLYRPLENSLLGAIAEHGMRFTSFWRPIADQ